MRTDYEAPHESGETDADEDESTLSPREILAFCVTGIRRNLWFGLAWAALVCVVGGTIVSALPPIYDSSFKIFVQPGGEVTSSLASGYYQHRPIEGSRGLREFIFAQDNLLSIAREARLAERWPETRPLPMRIKDDVWAFLFGEPTPREMEGAMAEMLEESITAHVQGESIIVHVQWRDAETARDIARLVKRNFLAARASHDLGPIRRAIPFLEAQLQQAEGELQNVFSELHALGTKSKERVKEKSREQLEQELERKREQREENEAAAEARALSRELSTVRRKRRELAEAWHRRTAELKTELIDLRAQYSDRHPKVQHMQARIDAASEGPEELQELRERESELMRKLSGEAGIRASVGEELGETEVGDVVPDALQHPEFATARSRLGSALEKAEEIAGRLYNATIVLATAEVDFNHRYVTIEEPVVPSTPLKAKKKKILFVLVFFAALVVGALSAIALQYVRGRLEEPWQVRLLGLPVLAEVDLKRLPPPPKDPDRG